VTYSNNLEKIETIRDDGLIEGADPIIAALTGRIDVRFADTTLIDLAAGGTPVDLEFAYTLSAMAKLVLTAHEVYLPKPRLHGIDAPELDQTFWWRGQQIVCGTMSLAALEALIAGVKVRCEVVERDWLVAKIFSPNGVDIGRRLVSAGWRWRYSMDGL
jgi:hypothetical protein